MENTTEILLLQKRAGIITEAQYKEKMQSLKEAMKPTEDELTTIAKYYITRNAYGKYNDAIKALGNKLENPYFNGSNAEIDSIQSVLFKIQELAKLAAGKGKLDPTERVEKLDSTLENKYKEMIQLLNITQK
jgi:hypothetical protein